MNSDNRNNSLFGKIDELLTKQKINNVMENLKKGNTDELARKIGTMDKADLIKKMDEFDVRKLQSMNINFAEIKSKITDEDLNKFSKIIGESGDEIVTRIKAFMEGIGDKDKDGDMKDGDMKDRGMKDGGIKDGGMKDGR